MGARGAARPTKADVARLAKVSPATVTYVLNNVEGQTISAQTRATVHAAAKELGYRPNLAARNLAVGGSGVVLYVVPRISLGDLLLEVGSRLTTEHVAVRRELAVVTRPSSRATHPSRWGADMRIKVLPYVSVEVDDRLRRRLRTAGERLRLNVRAYLLSAADDVDAAGDKVRDLCDAAVTRVDDAVAKVNDKLDPNAAARPTAEQDTRLEAS